MSSSFCLFCVMFWASAILSSCPEVSRSWPQPCLLVSVSSYNPAWPMFSSYNQRGDFSDSSMHLDIPCLWLFVVRLGVGVGTYGLTLGFDYHSKLLFKMTCPPTTTPQSVCTGRACMASIEPQKQTGASNLIGLGC